MVQVNSAQDLANMTVEELADRAGNRKTADSEAILAKKRMAAFKMSLISPVIFSTHNERSAAAYFDRIAASPLLFPDGKMRTVSRKTLERWVSAHRCAYSLNQANSAFWQSCRDKALPSTVMDETMRLTDQREQFGTKA